jgi:succinyl-CoA synthetase beta subunit
VNIHEYQAKDVLRRYGVPIPPGEVATTPEQAEEIARRVGKAVMVKAQVHVGGRGKAGGVKYCPTPEVAREKAEAILGMDIKGLTVEKVLVTEAADIGTEAYVGIIAFAVLLPCAMIREGDASTVCSTAYSQKISSKSPGVDGFAEPYEAQHPWLLHAIMSPSRPRPALLD